MLPVRPVRLGPPADAVSPQFSAVMSSVGCRRFATLLVAISLFSFYYHARAGTCVRDSATGATEIATQLAAAGCPSILNGWQYAAALFVGLLVLGRLRRAS